MSRRTRHHREHARKVLHTTIESAAQHAAELNADRPGEVPRVVYPCQWGNDWTHGDQAAMVHWHVGRPHNTQSDG